jgi:hypothetical protein
MGLATAPDSYHRTQLIDGFRGPFNGISQCISDCKWPDLGLGYHAFLSWDLAIRAMKIVDARRESRRNLGQ